MRKSVETDPSAGNEPGSLNGDGRILGHVAVDYITLSGGAWTDGLIDLPEHPDTTRRIEWRIGRYLYEGDQHNFACGSIQILREKEFGLRLYRISGGLAEKMIPDISLEFFRITRLDLCIDVSEEINLRHFYKEQIDHHRGTATIIADQTLYVGSRKSDRFWRIYDKAAEQGLPGPLFRIEVELKGQRARQARQLLLAGRREELFVSNAFGIIPGVLRRHFPGKSGGIDLSLPRKPRAGKKFLEGSIAPFLRRNAWAREWLIENGIFEEEWNGDMQDNR